MRKNLHALRDHEGGVEADAELADEAGVFFGALAERLQKGLRAGVGDGA